MTLDEATKIVDALIVTAGKEISKEPLDGDEVELVSMLFAIRLNWDNGNMTEVEYKQEIDKVASGLVGVN